MTDVANRTVLRELQEARATVSRLSAHNARSVGWEMRLAQQIQEKEDMRQERDSECHRAKLAESKAAAFVDKCCTKDLKSGTVTCSFVLLPQRNCRTRSTPCDRKYTTSVSRAPTSPRTCCRKRVRVWNPCSTRSAPFEPFVCAYG